MRRGVISFILALVLVSCFSGKAEASDWFTPFDETDWTLWGLTVAADVADMDSSYSMALNEQKLLRVPCSGDEPCKQIYRRQGTGEGNPMIIGLFGTRYPTGLDYMAWGAMELATQSLIAWALPKSWREAGFGIFIGLGVADTFTNAYTGGVVFRF